MVSCYLPLWTLKVGYCVHTLTKWHICQSWCDPLRFSRVWHVVDYQSFSTLIPTQKRLVPLRRKIHLCPNSCFIGFLEEWRGRATQRPGRMPSCRLLCSRLPAVSLWRQLPAQRRRHPLALKHSWFLGLLWIMSKSIAMDSSRPVHFWHWFCLQVNFQRLVPSANGTSISLSNFIYFIYISEYFHIIQRYGFDMFLNESFPVSIDWVAISSLVCLFVCPSRINHIPCSSTLSFSYTLWPGAIYSYPGYLSFYSGLIHTCNHIFILLFLQVTVSCQSLKITLQYQCNSRPYEIS